MKTLLKLFLLTFLAINVSYAQPVPPPGGRMAIGAPVTGGTSQSVLFVDSTGKLAQDNPGITYDPSTNTLSVSGASGRGISPRWLAYYTGVANGVGIYAEGEIAVDLMGLFRTDSAGNGVPPMIAGYDQDAATYNYSELIYNASTNVFSPAASDGASLGSGTLMWSDLFLASGSVINWNNGDVTLTHGSNVLTMAGGSLGIGAAPNTVLDVRGKTTVVQNVGDTAANKGLMITGEALVTTGPDPVTQGVAMVLTYNDTGNRQLGLFDSDDVGDNADTGFRYILGFDIPMIDGMSGSAATRRNINLGYIDNNVGFGFDVATAVQADIASKVDIRGSGTSTGRGLRVSDSAANENFSILDNGTTVFNETGKSADFRVESDTKTNALYVYGAGNQVGINATAAEISTGGGSVLTAKSDANGSFTNTFGAIAPNTTAGNRNCFNVGVTNSANNLNSFCFKYVGSGDTTNAFETFFSFAANPAMRVLANNTGGIGIASANPSAVWHAIGTGEQLRLGYDGSNYFSTTVNSTGSATLNLVGTSPEFTFSDAVNVPDDAYGAGWDSNTEVPTKNAVYDKIQTLPGPEFCYDAAELQALETSFAPLEKITGTNQRIFVRAFDDTTEEYANGKIKLPATVNSGTVTFRAYVYAKVADTANIAMTFGEYEAGASDTFDGAYSDEDSGDIAIDSTQGDITIASWTETIANMSWSANDLVMFRVSRYDAPTDDLPGDMYLLRFCVALP